MHQEPTYGTVFYNTWAGTGQIYRNVSYSQANSGKLVMLCMYVSEIITTCIFLYMKT
jgi:hypothetical protein